jgi:sec-independent protein translocase protein TatB
MFNIGVTEMMMIVGVALLVFGPNELPQIIKKVGKGLREVRRASDDLKASINLDGDDDRRRPMIRPATGTTSLTPPASIVPLAVTDHLADEQAAEAAALALAMVTPPAPSTTESTHTVDIDLKTPHG